MATRLSPLHLQDLKVGAHGPPLARRVVPAPSRCGLRTARLRHPDTEPIVDAAKEAVEKVVALARWGVVREATEVDHEAGPDRDLGAEAPEEVADGSGRRRSSHFSGLACQVSGEKYIFRGEVYGSQLCRG